MKPIEHTIGTAIFKLSELKDFIARCEAHFGCDASKIAVSPEAGGDWTGCSASDDSVFESDGSVELTASKIEC